MKTLLEYIKRTGKAHYTKVIPEDCTNPLVLFDVLNSIPGIIFEHNLSLTLLCETILEENVPVYTTYKDSGDIIVGFPETEGLSLFSIGTRGTKIDSVNYYEMKDAYNIRSKILGSTAKGNIDKTIRILNRCIESV